MLRKNKIYVPLRIVLKLKHLWCLLYILFKRRFWGTGRNCSWKDICCIEELSGGWKQGDDRYWTNEYSWFVHFLLCHNRCTFYDTNSYSLTMFLQEMDRHINWLKWVGKTGAFSRSAVNHNAGCKTAVSNIIMAVTVMVTLLFLMPLFQYTPNVVLGAIIVTAVVGLIDVPAACQIWKIDKFDFLVMLCAFLGVLFISVQEGLAIAVNHLILYWSLQNTPYPPSNDNSS